MDPVTIFSTIGTAIALAQTCLEISNFLSHIHTSYKESNNTVRSIEAECDVFCNSARLIKQWLEGQEEKASSELQLQLLNVGKALSLINESMKDLSATLHKITEKSAAIGPITGYNYTLNGSLGDSWLKAKFVFHEDALKGHLVELREHGGLLQFTLTTLQVYTSEISRGNQKADNGPGARLELLRDPPRRSSKLPLEHWPSDEHILQGKSRRKSREVHWQK